MRIEITGSTVVARDPETDEVELITTEADSDRWKRVNGNLWQRLNDVTGSYEDDPALNRPLGADVLRQIHDAGMSALMFLMGPERAANLDRIQAFCRARVPSVANNPNLGPTKALPIIDVVSRGENHLPLEVLPLLGKEQRGADGSDSIRALAQTLPGYCAVIRRRPLVSDDSKVVSVGAADVPVPIVFFKHDELFGARKEIEELDRLTRNGRLNLTHVFPGTGYRPNRLFAEAELVKEVVEPSDSHSRRQKRGQRLGFLSRAINVRKRADNRSVQSGTSRQTTGVGKRKVGPHICHFSCHLSEKNGPPALLMMPSGFSPPSAKYFLDKIPGAIPGALAELEVQQAPSAVFLVFLNTCHSGVQDKTLTSAVDVFRFFHPGCVIGTIADAPDQAAARFCTEFYEEMSAGSSVGVSLYAARANLLFGDLFNPFGLLFTSYFGEDLHLQLRQDRREMSWPNESGALALDPTG